MTLSAHEAVESMRKAVEPSFLCPKCHQRVYAWHDSKDQPCEASGTVSWIACEAWRYLLLGKGPKDRARGYGVR